MPAPVPVPELIALEIVARLGEITTDNDYAFDVSEVVRPTRRGENWQRKHLGIGVLQGTAERAEDLDYPGNPPALAYTLTFSLLCVCKDADASTDAHATNENEMAAAVVTAITDDGSDWHTMNGKAINSQFGSMEPFSSPEGEMNGVSLPLIVTYRVAENDPFTVRA